MALGNVNTLTNTLFYIVVTGVLPSMLVLAIILFTVEERVTIMSPTLIVNLVSGLVALAALVLGHFGFIPAEFVTFFLGLAGFPLLGSASVSVNTANINKAQAAAITAFMAASQPTPAAMPAPIPAPMPASAPVEFRVGRTTEQ